MLLQAQMRMRRATMMTVLALLRVLVLLTMVTTIMMRLNVYFDGVSYADADAPIVADDDGD